MAFRPPCVSKPTAGWKDSSVNGRRVAEGEPPS